MKLSLADVEHVATLARLGLTPEEKQSMQEQLSSILGHVEILSEVDTDAIPPTAQVGDLENVWRDDIVQPSLPRSEVLKNAPRQVEGYVEVHTPLTGEEESS